LEREELKNLKGKPEQIELPNELSGFARGSRKSRGRGGKERGGGGRPCPAPEIASDAAGAAKSLGEKGHGEGVPAREGKPTGVTRFFGKQDLPKRQARKMKGREEGTFHVNP